MDPVVEMAAALQICQTAVTVQVLAAVPPTPRWLWRTGAAVLVQISQVVETVAAMAVLVLI